MALIVQATYLLYFVLITLILPLHFSILYILIKLRTSIQTFRTIFYTTLVQNIIADIISLSIYGVEKILGLTIPEQLQKFRFLAAVFYYTIFWLIVLRTHGIVLLSVHRYLHIVQPIFYVATIRNAFQNSFVIFLLFWIPPLIINVILFADFRIQFFFVNGQLQTIPESSDITYKNTIIMMTLLIALCLISIICYVFIGKLIRKNSDSISKVMKRELRLALQVLILVVVQIIILLFFATVNILTAYQLASELAFFKSLTPFFYGLPSFCSPFTVLFFNRDLAKKIRELIFRGGGEQIASSSVIRANSNLR